MHRNNTSLIVLVIVIAVALSLFLGIIPPGISCFSSVPSGYTGILTTYGKVENESLDAGFHWKSPWQRIILMDNHIQTMRIASGVKNATTQDTAETKDQQLIPCFEFEIQYQLNADKAFMVYSNYGEDYTDVLLTSNALQFIKETFAQFNADEIVGNKDVIPKTIAEKIAAVSEPLGINIVRVNMVTYDFSEEYTKILEERALLNAQLENNQIEQRNATIAAQTEYDVAVKAAEKEAETKRIQAENANEIALKQAEAKAESDRIAADNMAYVTRTQAEAERDARLAAAEAERAELEAKASGINDYVIQQEFIAKWDGKLIPSFGDDGIGFTNYTDIIERYLFDQSEESE